MSQLDGGNQSLQSLCSRLLNRYDEVQAIVISTSDGVTIACSARDGGGGGGGAPPARRLEAGVARYFAGAADQAGKMNLGQLQSLTAFYENLMLYHINLLPLVVTLVADSQAAVGAVRAGAADVRAALAPVAAVVAEALDDRDLRGG
mmetsp:Transcript_27337/g.45117  ORF Transcript_27337/g.45117 Transcript_27337/m.45117 type:complete len:147 (+) Transcript_27337:109-549(+)